MARAHLRETIRNRVGDLMPSGTQVYVYRYNTTTAITDTMKNAPTSGTTLTNPLSVSATGQVEAWADSPGTDIPNNVTLSWSDTDSGTTQTLNADFFDPTATGTVSGFGVWQTTQAPPEVWVSVQGNDSYNASVIGRADYPYRTPEAAFAALASAGRNRGTIRFRAGPLFDFTTATGSFPVGAEYFELNAGIAATGIGLNFIGSGGSYYRNPNNFTSTLIKSAAGFPNDDSLIAFSGFDNSCQDLTLRQDNTASYCIQYKDPSGVGGEYLLLSRLVLYGGHTGVQLNTYQNDNTQLDQVKFAKQTTYGLHIRQTATAANNTHLDHCTFYWCGGTAGGAQTGAGIRIDGGTGPENCDMTTIKGGRFFGSAYAIDIHGGHSVCIMENQFEMDGQGLNGYNGLDGAMGNGSTTFTSASNTFTSGNTVGKTIVVAGAGAAGVDLVTTVASFTNATTLVLTDANASGGAVSAKAFVIDPVKDRPVINVDRNTANSGPDWRTYNLHIYDNYMHQSPLLTSNWTSGIGQHIALTGCMEVVVENNQHFINLATGLTTANPLVSLSATAFDCDVDVRMIGDTVTGRSTRPTDPQKVVGGAGFVASSGSRVLWGDPNG